MLRLLLTLLLLSLPTLACSARIHVAAAANFTAPMKEIARLFAARTGHEAVVSFGSTGKLYAQIHHGAPFQVFLAADQERPGLLHAADKSGPPRTYAIGRLALWSADPDLVDSAGQVLAGDGFERLALANPKTAPYGVGAMQILDALGLSGAVQPRLVRGDNIAQTYQFVMTGNAQLGFVATSQVAGRNEGSVWIPPQSLYTPLRQDVVLLEKGREDPAASEFVDFLFSEAAQQVVLRYGYATE